MTATTLLYAVYFLVFAFGTVIASFLNVVIWRIPRGESIVSPPSHCPNCNALIKWYQNLPILSYLALRGRCASCHTRISFRYPLIEALGGILFVLVFRYAPSWPACIVCWIWFSLLLVGTMIDFDHKLLPDFVTIGGMLLGLIFNGVTSIIHHSSFFILHSLSGLAFGFGLLWLIRFLGTKAFKREAMGMGDVLLMGAVGALYGPVSVIAVLVLSSVFGSIVGVALLIHARRKPGSFIEIPYGPYIALGVLIWHFFDSYLISLILYS